ncbi:Hpt domain protein [mine drainage metagenome]|uniref:Hpt domain protein n=1 Tax=mine drainage metagenome TaxID=410659 RepID=A0A1J5RWK1_9ZZZZ
MTADRRARLLPTFQRYAAECRTRAQALAALTAAEGAWDLAAIVHEAHSLAGSGATMGAEALGTGARALEQRAQDCREAGLAPDDETRRQMAAQAQALLDQARGFAVERMLDAFMAKMFRSS